MTRRIDPPDLRWYRDSHLDRGWTARAACRGENPELWFPNQQDENRGETKANRAMRLTAQAICSGCEVKHACLEHALAIDARFGIWGGLTEADRRRLRRGRSA